MHARHLDLAETPQTHFPVTSTRTRATRDRTGELIAGKWRLQKLLGTGGASSVYAASHKNGKRVALKLLHPDFANNEIVRARFLREPRATNLVEHKGVVSVHDEGQTQDGELFFVMDLLQGCTLDQRMATSPRLDWRAALALAERVLEILIVAHKAGVIHRDIKPANVFLSGERGVCLLDFGIASIAQDSSLTEAGVPVGTPAYMAPEQARANWELVNLRADIWGVGALLWFCFTGAPPRRATTVDQALNDAQRRPLPSLSKVSTVPQAVADFVDRALAFDSAQRFRDARAMQTELLNVRVRLQSQDLAVTLDVPRLRPPRQGGKLWAGTKSFAVVLTMVALAALVPFSNKSTVPAGQRPAISVSLLQHQPATRVSSAANPGAIATRAQENPVSLPSPIGKRHGLTLERPSAQNSAPGVEQSASLLHRRRPAETSQQDRKLRHERQKQLARTEPEPPLSSARISTAAPAEQLADIQSPVAAPLQTAEAFDPLSARL